MKARFSRRHDPDLQENLLVDLIGAVSCRSGESLLDSDLREADLQSMATTRRLRERMMTSKREQRLNPMAATHLVDGIRRNRGRRDRTDALGYSL
jgi:hypothetical protein